MFGKIAKSKRIFLTFTIFLSLILLIFIVPKVRATDDNNIKILYQNSNIGDDPLLISLDLDNQFDISKNNTVLSSSVDGLELYQWFDVIILVDPVYEQSIINKILEFISAGGGLFYICGPEQSINQEMLVNFKIVDTLASNIIQNNSERAIPDVNNTDTNILTSIDWNSAPEVANYTIIPSSPTLLYPEVIIDISKQPIDDSATIETHPLILHREYGDGMIFVSTSWLADPRLESQHLWPYFNYLIYSITVFAAQETKLSYAAWDYSPVPHLLQQIVWSIFVVLLLSLTIYVYKRQRKKSKSELRTEVIEKFSEKEEIAEESQKISENEANEEFSTTIAETAEKMKEEEIDEWEEIGYHRQMSGFLFALFMAFILIGPQLVLTLFIYPNYILPYPQAGGYYSFVLRFFEAFWLFLDFGTSTAAAKFFAQYRVKQPEKAIKYVQIYIWWQFLSGIGQFAVVSMIGLYVFPHTKYAHMSWFFILHSLIQYPGFLAVFLYFFQGVQRLDIAQLLEMVKTVIFSLLFQYIMVLLFRWIFGMFPAYGEVFGAVVGMAIGSWCSEFAFFGLSYRMFRRLGYEGKTLFRIDFGMDEIREAFKYGLRLVMGNVWVPLVWFLQVILISIYVADYSSEMAYFDLAMTLSQIMSLVGLYLGGMMPPISESLGNGKKKLFNLGMVEMIRVMNWILYCIAAILLVCGNRIILGLSGPSWQRATVYFSGLLLHAIMGPYSWSADRVFQGTGRTDLNLYTWILEQGIRAICCFIFIPMIGMMGVIIAYNIALFTKDIAVWILIRKIIWKGKAYPWKTFAAPILSGVCLYFLLEGLARLIWTGDILTTIILTVICLFGGVFLGVLFNGFFGLWDENSLAELKKAADMVKTVGFLARGVYKMAEIGAIKLKSPFYKLNKVDIYEEAMEEARALTHEKRVLKV